MAMPKIKKSTSKRTFSQSQLVAGLVILLVVGAAIAYGAYYLSRSSSSKHSTAAINYGPPTKADQQQNDENKKRIVQEGQNPVPPPSGTKAVTPTITYLDQFQQTMEVGGFVGVFEEGGTCTATFTLGSTTVTKSVAAVRDASSVDCPVMTVPTSQL